MINRKYFFKGLKSLINLRSPAIALSCSFVALGALMHNAGFNLQQSAASSFFIYALPGQLVMTESFLEPLGFSSDEEGSYDAEFEEQEMLTSLDLAPMSETQHKDGFMGLSLQQQKGDGTESMRGGAESVGNQSSTATSMQTSKNYNSRMSLGVSGRQISEDSDQYNNMDTSSGFY